MSTKVLWAWYIFGAVLTLVVKWASYVYHGKQMGKSIWTSTKEWFLDATLENTASWVTSIANIGVAWTIGRIYINRMPMWDMASLPLDNAISFTLGVIAEIIAPNCVKWLISKFPGGGQ